MSWEVKNGWSRRGLGLSGWLESWRLWGGFERWMRFKTKQVFNES